MEIVPACTNAKLKAVIRCKLNLEIEIHPYGLLRYDGVNDTGCDKHYCVLISVIVNLLVVIMLSTLLIAFGFMSGAGLPSLTVYQR